MDDGDSGFRRTYHPIACRLVSLLYSAHVGFDEKNQVAPTIRSPDILPGMGTRIPERSFSRSLKTAILGLPFFIIFFRASFVRTSLVLADVPIPFSGGISGSIPCSDCSWSNWFGSSCWVLRIRTLGWGNP